MHCNHYNGITLTNCTRVEGHAGNHNHGAQRERARVKKVAAGFKAATGRDLVSATVLRRTNRKRCEVCNKLTQVRFLKPADIAEELRQRVCGACRMENASCIVWTQGAAPSFTRTYCTGKADLLTDDGYVCKKHADDYASCEGCDKVLPQYEFNDDQGAGRCDECVKRDNAADLAKLRAEQAACHVGQLILEGECEDCGRTYYEVRDQTISHGVPQFVYFDGEVYRWASNDRVPPDDCLQRFWINRLPKFDLGAQRRAEDAQRAL